ncbi:MAG: hypothetical protein E7K72_10775 [Roseomonas mucosa]|nr:hypothetical protein [Roseomonas mucosa]
MIVGDSAFRTMADHGGGWDEVSARAIADEFLRQNSSIGFVLLLSVREQRKEWFNVDPPVRQLHATLAVSRTQAVPGDLKPLFRRMMESMPDPVTMPVNAAQRARETGYGLGHHGGIRLSGNRVRISAREVMEILAGRLTVEKANSWRGWNQADGDARTGASQNPFERWLTQGRLPSSVTVVKCGEVHDDDWLEIEVGEPDPAITRFS